MRLSSCFQGYDTHRRLCIGCQRMLVVSESRLKVLLDDWYWMKLWSYLITKNGALAWEECAWAFRERKKETAERLILYVERVVMIDRFENSVCTVRGYLHGEVVDTVPRRSWNQTRYPEGHNRYLMQIPSVIYNLYQTVCGMNVRWEIRLTILSIDRWGHVALADLRMHEMKMWWILVFVRNWTRIGSLRPAKADLACCVIADVEMTNMIYTVC